MSWSFIDKINYILEAFKDIGKLSPEQLKKGQKLDPEKDENFSLVDGRVFYKAVSKIRQNDIAKGDMAKGLDTLTVYKPNEYNQMKCYLGINNSSGYAIAHSNELVSVFSSQGSSGKAIVKDAIKNGAKKLDCFAIRNPKTGNISGDLYRLYSLFGFKIDKSINIGKSGEPFTVINGISDYVDEAGKVHPEDERVVIFMKK